MDNQIMIEVAYALEDHQLMVTLMVDNNSTVEQAIRVSGMLERCPEIDLSQCKVGIWSKPCELSQLVKNEDRIEIYRPITADPKQARLARAKSD